MGVDIPSELHNFINRLFAKVGRTKKTLSIVLFLDYFYRGLKGFLIACLSDLTSHKPPKRRNPCKWAPKTLLVDT